MLKKEIAKQMKQKRLELDVSQKKAFDEAIVSRMKNLVEKDAVVALFMPLKGEVNVLPLFDEFKDVCKIVFPKVISDTEMIFYEVSDYDDFVRGTFNLLEPKETCPLVLKEDIDLFFIPLLAYNEKHYRIGYGRGYYDRYLSQSQALKYGVAYTFQKVDVAFEDEYDVACDGIVTERGIE